jgi:hypothetical protein
LLLKFLITSQEAPPSLVINTSTLSSEPKVPGDVPFAGNTPKSNSI